MCEYLNYEVITLKRIRIMNIEFDIPTGTYRELTDEEFKTLKRLIQGFHQNLQPKQETPEDNMTQLSPFHLAIPVHNLEECRQFYTHVLNFEEGRKQ
jgi:4-hydroxyphenylpyruvate dioxygenase-like putative hemolysin